VTKLSVKVGPTSIDILEVPPHSRGNQNAEAMIQDAVEHSCQGTATWLDKPGAMVPLTTQACLMQASMQDS
jgi:hypothetical protein